jgi:hypothetical protein
MREKECKLVTGEHMPFDVANLRYYTELPKEQGLTLIAIDPASSDSKTADDTAIVAMRIIGQDIYVLEVFAETGVMPDAAAAKFFEFVWKYNPMKGVIETVSYQRVLKWYLEQEMMRRRLYIPLDPIQDKRKKHDRIMQALQQPLQYRQLYLREGAQDIVKFVHQLGDFSPGVESRDDVLDALAMGITSVNPGLRFAADDAGSMILPQVKYKQLEFRGAP